MGGKAELIKALSLATLEFKPIGKNSTAKVTTKNGGQYSYSYATLDDIIIATKEALSRHGLAITHTTKDVDGKMWLISKLRHESGCPSDKVKSQIDKFITDSHMSAVQSYGSIITYLKRYHIGMLLNIALDEDDDGVDKGEKLKANEKGESVPLEKPTADEYIKRIEACKNIFEIKSWGEKHKEEMKTLVEGDLKKVREVFSLHQDLLQKEHDIDKLSQLTKKAKDVIRAFLDNGDLWGKDAITKALKGNPDAITDLKINIEGYVADKSATDLLGDGEKVHNPPQ